MNTNAPLMKAHHQWAARPADQRFVSLTEMLDFKNRVRNMSTGKVISSRAVEVIAPNDRDVRALTIVGANGGSEVTPTHWAFGQMAQLIGAPAKYLRDLPAQLVADCMNFGFMKRDVEDVGVLVCQDEQNSINQLSCMTGPNYGRIWDADILAQLTNRFGDGITGQFKVPGEFGHDVTVTKANTTLYASDRDMFVFLADEKNRIEVPDRRNGEAGSLARGFFVWNSEVGNATFGMSTFLFDYVCKNRIVWGPREYQEITIRHTSGAPDRFIEEIAPAVEAYAESSARSITEAVTNAKAKRLEDDVTEFLAKRTKFSRRQIAGMVAAHQADEGRPMETVWDAVTGMTAYARGMQHQDARVEIETQAGKILDLTAN